MSKTRSANEQLGILMRSVECDDEKTRANMEAELRQRPSESAREGRPMRVYCGFTHAI